MRALPFDSLARCALLLAAIALLPAVARESAAAQIASKSSAVATSPDGIRIAYETHGSGARGAASWD